MKRTTCGALIGFAAWFALLLLTRENETWRDYANHWSRLPLEPLITLVPCLTFGSVIGALTSNTKSPNSALHRT